MALTKVMIMKEQQVLVRSLIFTLIEATPAMGFNTAQQRLDHAIKQINLCEATVNALLEAHERKYP